MLPSVISTESDVLITMERNVFKFLSTLEVVDVDVTKAVETVDNGMSTPFPLPSSPVIIPAVSEQIVVQLCLRSRQ